MTPGEFKAWFDGFTEAFTSCPTKAQWSRIKARVAEIDGNAVTERVYVDRYWPLYNTLVSPPNRWITTYCGAGIGATSNTSLQNAGYATAFNSTAAMGDLGRAEAQSLAV